MATGHGASGHPLPGYVLRDRIGQGPIGEVWRGEPVGRPGRVVAIKRLLLDVDRAALAALRQDADALARLSHPAILPILDIVTDDPGVAIVTRYAPGGSLADRLGRLQGGLDAIQVADLGARIGAALAASHDAGIIHGNVKPTNILFGADGHPLVADLGAAHLRGSSDPLTGTAAYLDPASGADGRPRGPTTDVDGLAATLDAALTGVPPSAGPNAHETLAASDRGVHVPTGELMEVPSDLTAIIERGLHRDPAERFSTIAEMADALEACRRRLGSAPPPPPPAAVFPTTRPSTDRRLLLLAAALVISIPFGIVMWLATSSGGDVTIQHTLPAHPEDPARNEPAVSAADEPTDGDPEQRTADPTEPVATPHAAPPPCPDAVTPILNAPTQPADVDGRGCSVPAAWDGQVLEVAIDGQLRRFDLPGDEPDTLLFGDFNCDGRETPALYRPASGELFVFPSLDPDAEVTVRAEPDLVPDATAEVVLDEQGCARVDLRTTAG